MSKPSKILTLNLYTGHCIGVYAENTFPDFMEGTLRQYLHRRGIDDSYILEGDSIIGSGFSTDTYVFPGAGFAVSCRHDDSYTECRVDIGSTTLNRSQLQTTLRELLLLIELESEPHRFN